MSSQIQDRGLTEIAARALGHTPLPWQPDEIGGNHNTLYHPGSVRAQDLRVTTFARNNDAAFASIACNAFYPMLTALETVEFVEIRSADPATTRHECQSCGNDRDEGHAPGCLVAAGLAAARGAQS